MLVPENCKNVRHIISMYLATCGANGHLLGSDEKEIIYLVFGIIDLQSKEIIGIKQYLVKPVGIKCNNNAVKSSATSPNTSATSTSSESGSVSSLHTTEILIPDSIIQSAGRSLNEVISDFDAYLRSLKIDQNNVCLVTDGQLPLRQCLHPESSAKEIILPSYYWKFSDLKKEYLYSKSGDLSHNLPNMQTVSSNQLTSLVDILNEMELQSMQESSFYIKESRDMITIVQSMLVAGHLFNPNEIVNQSLEPGICSIDDEIDGNCIVRARGLPWQSSDQDIAKFFRGLNVTKGGVALCLSPQGRRNGEALVRFISQEHRDMALKRHKHHIGSRYIEVYRATGEDFLAVAGGASNEAQIFLSKGAQVIIRMRGLPYDCTPNQVLEFFANGENSCKVLDDNEGILFVKKPDGRSTGDAFVLFADESDAPKALSKHRESIGQRYIELFRSTIAEVQQVLNRSMDPKTYEHNNITISKPPLIAQIPQTLTQMPMLPQHVITSGTEKNCIRLRGLPYEAKVEHILHFLEDFAKHIVYQGVHLVYNAQGQFNGEAFIQMDSESSAQASAQQKHHKHMMFGKKQRYIEVFQCSGEDMNMVLNGGYHHHHHHFQSSPTISAKPPQLTSGMLPSRNQTSSVQPLQVSIPPPLSIPLSLSQAVIPTASSSTNAAAINLNNSANQPTTSSSLIAQQQQTAHFIAQQNLMARQQAAAAAAQFQAAQQQSAAADQVAFLQNFSFLSSPAAAAAVASNNITQTGGMHTTNPYASFPLSPQVPQFFYLPRPIGFPTMLSMPTGINQIQMPSFAGVVPTPGYVHNAAQLSNALSVGAQLNPAAAMTSQSASSTLASTSVKRSYESAFRNDPMTVSAAKRAFHHSNQSHAANIYGNLHAPAFQTYNQYPPAQIYSSPPQIFYWTGYPSGPISPTGFIQPLHIPPHHTFHSFTHDRPALFPEVNMMEQQPQSHPPSPQNHVHQLQHQQILLKAIELNASLPQQQQQQLPDQSKAITNLNFHCSENGNLDRVNASKALCYQSQELGNNILSKKILVIHQKNEPVVVIPRKFSEQEPQVEHNDIDCNNNSTCEEQMSIDEKVTHTAHQITKDIFAPKPLDPQFIQPSFMNHLNMISSYKN